MTTAFLPRFTTTSLLVLATLGGGLLSGCGGGNDHGVPGANNNTGSNANPASDPTGPFLFGVTTSSTGKRLSVIDGPTGTELTAASKTVELSSTQLIAQAFSVADGGWTQTAGAQTEAFYTSGKKIFKVSLSQPSATHTQVSSLSNVCSLSEIIPKAANAQASWLVVNTSSKNDCDDAASISAQLVSSDAASTAAPAAPAVALATVVAVMRDSAGAFLGAVVSAKPGSNGAQLASMDASGELSLLASRTSASGKALPYEYFGRVAGTPSKVYLRTRNNPDGADKTSSLFTLDMSSGSAKIGTTATASLASNTSALIASDASATYFDDMDQIKKIDASGKVSIVLADLKTLWPVDTTLENADAVGTAEATGVALSTTNYLILSLSQMAQDDVNPAYLPDQPPVQKLFAISKTGDKVLTMGLGNNEQMPRVVARQGDALVVSQGAAEDYPNKRTLTRFDLSTGSVVSSTVANANLIAQSSYRGDLSNDPDQPYVFWSSKDASGTTVTANAMQVGSGQITSVSSSADVAAWTVAQADAGTSPYYLLTASFASAADKLWIFNPSLANSIKAVATGN